MKDHHAFAVIDPNWGDPLPLLTTIRDTEQEAIDAALVTKEGLTSLYSGFSDSCVPPKVGKWENLTGHGYKVARISIRRIE